MSSWRERDTHAPACLGKGNIRDLVTLRHLGDRVGPDLFVQLLAKEDDVLLSCAHDADSSYRGEGQVDLTSESALPGSE